MFGRRGNDTGNKPESGIRPAAPKPAISAAISTPAQSAVQPSRMQAAVPTTQARSPAQPGTQGREKTEIPGLLGVDRYDRSVATLPHGTGRRA